jgi:NCS1 family nucleobase:cation symporter-1
LQGIDLAWVVGLLFPAACYYRLMSKRRSLAAGTVKS